MATKGPKMSVYKAYNWWSVSVPQKGFVTTQMTSKWCSHTIHPSISTTFSRTSMTGRLFLLLHRQSWSSNTLKQSKFWQLLEIKSWATPKTRIWLFALHICVDIHLFPDIDITLIHNLVASSLDTNAARNIDTPEIFLIWCWLYSFLHLATRIHQKFLFEFDN